MTSLSNTRRIVAVGAPRIIPDALAAGPCSLEAGVVDLAKFLTLQAGGSLITFFPPTQKQHTQ
jgi:hypothetical protein